MKGRKNDSVRRTNLKNHSSTLTQKTTLKNQIFRAYVLKILGHFQKSLTHFSSIIYLFLIKIFNLGLLIFIINI